MITPAQRAAYHEAARAHSIPALIGWLITLAASAAAFIELVMARSEA